MKPVDTLTAASKYLKIPQAWIKEQIDSGKLPCLKVGKNIRLRKRDLDNLFEKVKPGVTK